MKKKKAKLGFFARKEANKLAGKEIRKRRLESASDDALILFQCDNPRCDCRDLIIAMSKGRFDREWGGDSRAVHDAAVAEYVRTEKRARRKGDTPAQ